MGLDRNPTRSGNIVGIYTAFMESTIKTDISCEHSAVKEIETGGKHVMGTNDSSAAENNSRTRNKKRNHTPSMLPYIPEQNSKCYECQSCKVAVYSTHVR